jgi:UDP-N-acetylglucosamine 2-epimerase (non-hydrolysing)/GDP/UDP-N,N'-diacetylbacillosamine 2-epimerase (hydrolysing)
MTKTHKRKIAVVTGTRAEYGFLKPIMEKIKNSPFLELQTVVVGMHLSQKFGMTVKEIEKDGFRITGRAKMTPEEDSSFAMAMSIGDGIRELANLFIKLKPEIILVLGDRTESLAAAIAGAYMNIVVGHIHGGDSAKAGLDESARHAITKFAHLHFPATQKSAIRIHKMGEEDWRIYLVGSPSIDGIFNMKKIPKNEIFSKYGLNIKKPLFLVLQHAVSTQVAEASWQIEQTFKALANFKTQTIIIYPNADAGGQAIIKRIEEFKHKCPFFQIHKSLPREDYLSFLETASVLIGNSSSGIIEAPVFHLPVVDIGIRQEGREQSTNILHVAHHHEEIKIAIKKAIYDQKFLEEVSKCQNLYGAGQASRKIARVLSNIEINSKLIQKKITY